MLDTRYLMIAGLPLCTRRAAGVLAVVLTIGCTEPRLDGSSAEAFKDSLPAVRRTLDPEDQKTLNALVGERLMGGAAAGVMLDEGPNADIVNDMLWVDLDGLTGREAVALYREEKAQEQEEGARRKDGSGIRAWSASSRRRAPFGGRKSRSG